MDRVCFLFFLASFAFANGFHTKKCNQNLLELKTMGMIKCMSARFKEVEHLFQPSNMQNLENNPLGCDFIDKNVACWNNHLGSCFNDDFKNDMATLWDASYENQVYVSCHRNGARRTNQLTLVQQRLTQKYAQYRFQPEKLNDIIQLEGQCSSSTFKRSIQRGTECFMSKAQMQMFRLSLAVQSGALSNNADLPVCELLSTGLECFDLKECLSDQESKFVGNLIVTLYKVMMNELDRVLKLYPGSTLAEYISKNGVSKNEAQMGLNILQGAIKDSKTNSCKTSLKKWKDCTVDCTYSDSAFLSIGCWKDEVPRAVPSLEGNSVLDMHYKSRSGAIQKCFNLASSLGYNAFAVQDGGQCMTSSSAETTYDKYGPSSECLSDGEGGPLANDVYMINNIEPSVNEEDAQSLPPNGRPVAEARKSAPSTFVSLGCWKDKIPRAINGSLEGMGLFDEHYKRRPNPVQDCFQAALSKGFEVFAIQDGGQCFSSTSAKDTYNQYGASTNCLGDGKGGPMANHVYEINKGD